MGVKITLSWARVFFRGHNRASVRLLARVGPLVRGNVALLAEPPEKNGTPRSPGPSLDFPPLPVGGTYRAWGLLYSTCAISHSTSTPCPTPVLDFAGVYERDGLVSRRRSRVILPSRAFDRVVWAGVWVGVGLSPLVLRGEA